MRISRTGAEPQRNEREPLATRHTSAYTHESENQATREVGTQDMNQEPGELRALIAALEDDELLQMVARASKCSPEAVQMAQAELQRRASPSYRRPTAPPSPPEDSSAPRGVLALLVSWPIRTLRALDRDGADKFLRISTTIIGVIWLPSLMVACFAGMIFDAPHSDENPLAWCIFFYLAAFPLVCLASVNLSWIVFACGRHTAACLIAVTPAVYSVPFLITIAMTTVTSALAALTPF